MAEISLSCRLVDCPHHNKDYVSGGCKSPGVVSIDGQGMCWVARRVIEGRKTSEVEEAAKRGGVDAVVNAQQAQPATDSTQQA